MGGSLMKNKLSLLDSFQTLVQPNEWQNKQWLKLLDVELPLLRMKTGNTLRSTD